MKKELKKAGAAALAAALVMTAAIPVYADETGAGDTPAQQSNLKLTTSMEAHYIMTIPMQASGEASIPFGKVDTDIGDLAVEGDIGTKQQVSVTVEQTPFTDVKDPGNKDFWLIDEEAAVTGANLRGPRGTGRKSGRKGAFPTR